jgi:hypothetical protein
LIFLIAAPAKPLWKILKIKPAADPKKEKSMKKVHVVLQADNDYQISRAASR